MIGSPLTVARTRTANCPVVGAGLLSDARVTGAGVSGFCRRETDPPGAFDDSEAGGCGGKSAGASARIWSACGRAPSRATTEPVLEQPVRPRASPIDPRTSPRVRLRMFDPPAGACAGGDLRIGIGPRI